MIMKHLEEGLEEEKWLWVNPKRVQILCRWRQQFNKKKLIMNKSGGSEKDRLVSKGEEVLLLIGTGDDGANGRDVLCRRDVGDG